MQKNNMINKDNMVHKNNPSLEAEKPLNEKKLNEKTFSERSFKEKSFQDPLEERSNDEKTNDGRTKEEKTNDKKTNEETVKEEKTNDRRTKEEKTNEEKIKELTEILQRTQANFENYRKQQEKRVQEFYKMAGKDFILQLLPIVDYFELALKNMGDLKIIEANEKNVPDKGLKQDPNLISTNNVRDNNIKEFIKGMELIYSQLKSLLHENGVKEIETVGKKFDPYSHEALMRVESELPADMVIEEFQKGYMLHEQVIRHARVKLSHGKNKSEVQKK